MLWQTSDMSLGLNRAMEMLSSLDLGGFATTEIRQGIASGSSASVKRRFHQFVTCVARGANKDPLCRRMLRCKWAAPEL